MTIILGLLALYFGASLFRLVPNYASRKLQFVMFIWTTAAALIAVYAQVFGFSWTIDNIVIAIAVVGGISIYLVSGREISRQVMWLIIVCGTAGAIIGYINGVR